MSLPWRYRLEYVAVRAAAALVQRLPYRAALLLGWAAAALLFHGVRFRRAAALARLEQVFGDRLSARQRRRIAWRSWRNFCFSAIEMIRLPVSSPAWVRSVVDVGDAADGLRARVRAGQGALIATAHMGSWEMAALTSLAIGVPLFSLAARQNNPLVDEFINRMRSGTGFETLLRDGTVLKRILRNLRAGKVLAILPDVRSPTPGLPVRFLGHTANIAGGMALLARQAGVPIYPSVITRLGWARHRYRTTTPVWPDPAVEKRADWLRMTQAVFDVFDRAIREQPDQWFWFNKRWILDPLPPAGNAPADTSDEGRG